MAAAGTQAGLMETFVLVAIIWTGCGANGAWFARAPVQAHEDADPSRAPEARRLARDPEPAEAGLVARGSP